MGESNPNRAFREVVGIVQQREAVLLLRFGSGEVIGIGGNGGPALRGEVPLIELDDVAVFAKVVAVDVETDRRRRDVFVAPELEAVVEARIPADLVDLKGRPPIGPGRGHISGMGAHHIPAGIGEIPRDGRRFH